MSAHHSFKNHELFKTGYFVGGKWYQTKETFEVFNPATGEVIAQVASSGKRETEAAIKAAKAAFPAWRQTPGKERAEILQCCRLMIDNQHFLAELMVTEQGKPLKEAMAEVEYAPSFIQWFSEQAKRANGEIIPAARTGVCSGSVIPDTPIAC